MRKVMLWKIASAIVFALLVICPLQDAHASGFAIYTQGAASLGQGNSTTAHLNSPSAIFLNPALINRLEGTKLEIGTTLISPTREFTSDATGRTLEAEENLFFPSTLFVTHKYNDTLSFGLGIFNPFGLGNEWGEKWEGRYITSNNELTTFNINPVVAYQVTPELSVAAGLDFLILKATQEGLIDLPALGFGFQGGPYAAPSDGKKTFEGDGNGIGYNIGILYDINEDISFGASYRSEIYVDIDGEASFSIPSSTDPVIAALFPDSDGRANITLPQQVHAGIAYSGIDNLTLEGGIRWEGWSSYQQLKIKLDTTGALGQAPAIVKDWHNTFSYLIGGEYQLNEMVALRAGYLYANNPIPDDTFEPSIPDADTDIFTVGTGITFTQCKLDLAYAFQNLRDRDKDNTVSDAFNPANDANGNYKTNMHIVGISLTHTF